MKSEPWDSVFALRTEQYCILDHNTYLTLLELSQSLKYVLTSLGRNLPHLWITSLAWRGEAYVHAWCIVYHTLRCPTLNLKEWFSICNFMCIHERSWFLPYSLKLKYFPNVAFSTINLWICRKLIIMKVQCIKLLNPSQEYSR